MVQPIGTRAGGSKTVVLREEVSMTAYDQPTTSVAGHTAGAPSAPAPGRAIRWGPAWTGALTAVPVFVVLQLLFVAFGWLSLGVDGPGSGVATSIVSAVLAIVALFVGGLAGGTASGSGPGSATAALQGVMIWALTVVGMIALSLLGGGVLAGNLGAVASDPAVGGQAGQAVRAVQDAAGWGALWLGVALAAAIGGATAGARVRPPRTSRA
jgi:hypothetical protein